MRTERETNIELLRIIAMIMIVSHHFAVHGGFSFEGTETNSIFVDVFAIWGKIGVNLFFLIMGYFSAQIKFKPNKIINFMALITFYSVCLYFISVGVGAVEFRKKELFYSFFPIIVGGGYWFTTTYIEIYMLAPFLNRIIKQIGKREYSYAIGAGLLLFSIFPFTIGQIMKLNNFGYSNLIWFILIYCIGAYISRYKPHEKCNRMVIIAFFTMCAVVFVFFRVVASMSICENKWLSYLLFMASDYNENAIFVVLLSALIFMIFLNIEVKSCGWIYAIAGTTFGVYLLHDNKNFSSYMWEHICKTIDFQDNALFPAYAIICILTVFTVCSCIELLRIAILKKIKKY